MNKCSFLPLFAACAILVVPGTSGASPEVSTRKFEERFAAVFKTAFTISDYVGEIQKLDDLDFDENSRPLETREQIADRVYCFTPKTVWSNVSSLGNIVSQITGVSTSVQWNAQEIYPKGQVGYNDWDASYFKNSGSARCEQYRLEFAEKNEPEFARYVTDRAGEATNALKGGYLVGMPRLRASYQREKKIHDKISGLREVIKTAKAKLTETGGSSSAFVTERSLALTAVQVIDAQADPSLLFNQADALNSQQLKRYTDTMAFLAVVAKEHIRKTGGNLDVWREFGLELEVRDLDKRVMLATQIAEAALDRAGEARAKADHQSIVQMIQQGEFWGATILFGSVLSANLPLLM
jgi:hypothetical protein